ncbi:MAG TPA: FkbM family methyltransferase [Ferruginibacter sp.]|nr:FkbM family methyltransferase [Ferruginibacter sp.]
MLNKDFIKRWYIKVCRYLFGQKYLTVMAGPLKGYLWSTGSSYEYILGHYEDPEMMKVFLGWLKPDSVLYDLGANVGFHALTANRYIASGKIYSFEPFPAARLVFQKHISLNKKFIAHDNISLLTFAISDEEKQVEFSNDQVQKDGNTYIKDSAVFSSARDKISVKTDSIDGLVKKGYEQPDIMKIDVEGAEYDVLRGAINTIRQYKPNILLATHDCHLPGVKDDCIRFLEDLGYTLKHTGWHNRHMEGIDDYIAVHKDRL